MASLANHTRMHLHGDKSPPHTHTYRWTDSILKPEEVGLWVWVIGAGRSHCLLPWTPTQHISPLTLQGGRALKKHSFLGSQSDVCRGSQWRGLVKPPLLAKIKSEMHYVAWLGSMLAEFESAEVCGCLLNNSYLGPGLKEWFTKGEKICHAIGWNVKIVMILFIAMFTIKAPIEWNVGCIHIHFWRVWFVDGK